MADNLMGDIPTDFQPEMQNISQQQKMAQMLMQQAFQQPQGQMVSGRYVAPSILQQLQPLFGAYVGTKGMEAAENKQLELAKAIRTQGDIAAKDVLNTFKQDQNAGLQKALQYQQFPQVKAVLPQLSKALETPSAVQEFNYAQQHPEFANYEFAKKRAGAPSVSVSMDKGLAAQVGPMMKESKEKTIGAVKEIDAANQVIGAIDSNKMFTGPLANQRLSAAQLGSTLGVGGKDVTEKINNTRQAIQGLAEITLQGRQEMRGQGAITESEGKLAERAKSGDISLTPGELKQLAGAAKRAGEYTFNQHQTQLQAMSQNPETRQLMPYYNVPMMPERQVQQAPVQPNANQQLNIPATTGGWSVKSVK
jgi:hypothetical protein